MDPTPTVGKLPEVRVDLLKRRKALALGRAKEIRNRIDNRKRDKVPLSTYCLEHLSRLQQRRSVRFKRLESYVAQHQRQEKDLKRARRVANELLTKKKTDRERRIETKNYGRAAFVVRVRGINQVHSCCPLKHFTSFYTRRFIHVCVKLWRHSASMARTWASLCE